MNLGFVLLLVPLTLPMAIGIVHFYRYSTGTIVNFVVHYLTIILIQ